MAAYKDNTKHARPNEEFNEELSAYMNPKASRWGFILLALLF
jgi:hypothetical protein